MVYKQKLAVLSGIVGFLALIYIISLVFEPERMGRRNAAFTWLDPKTLDLVEGISISGPGNSVVVELVRKDNAWYVSHEGNEYPARQFRVDDFLGILTRRAAYPVRASTPAAHEGLGLTEDAASRIVLTGPPARGGAVLLDLLLGQGDLTGQEIYLRTAGRNEVRSGENLFSGYISGSRTSWYNLRLFPESESGQIDVSMVQRLTVYPPEPAGPEGGTPETQIFSREGRGWNFSGIAEAAGPDSAKVDSYIQGILNAEGDDFSSAARPEDPIFNDGRIVLELEDGSIKTLKLGREDESNHRLATISGSSCVYSLAGWLSGRLFREASYFEVSD
ncbi:MAG: hypothetical protein LBK02_00495 [Treponema sp.]|nr:hypothetical protein [Treponema sp.]